MYEPASTLEEEMGPLTEIDPDGLALIRVLLPANEDRDGLERVAEEDRMEAVEELLVEGVW